MNRSTAVIAPAALALLAAASSLPVSAYTGDDPVFATGVAACYYKDIQAHIGPSGAVTYKVYGNCSGSEVSGQVAYSNGKFQESFIISNYGKISTVGYCDTDPWATAVNCHDQLVQSSSIAFDPELLRSAPLTLINGGQGFHDAFLHASRPNPPGIPVNLSSTFGFGQVTAKWLAPDASGDRPFLGFLMQVRPQNAEGAAWTDIGTIAWHPGLEYRLAGKTPPLSAAFPAWDVRVCSTTALTMTCSPAQLPTWASFREATEVKNDQSAKIALLNPAPAAAPAPGAVHLGRVPITTPPDSTLTICDHAKSARERNSPAAPGLERQCDAYRAAHPEPPPAPAPASAPSGPVMAPNDLVVGRISYLQNGQAVDQVMMGSQVTIACNYFVATNGRALSFIREWRGSVQTGGQVPQTMEFPGATEFGSHEARVYWTPAVVGNTPISCVLNQGFENAEADGGNNRANVIVDVVSGDEAMPPAGDDAPPPPAQ